MKQIAIVFVSPYGQTAKIAERLATVLRERDHDVTTFALSKQEDLSLKNLSVFDGFIIGGPVYAGKFPKSLVEWTRNHVTMLNGLPTAFFSVSLNAADKRSDARKEDTRLINQFLTETGLKTKVTASLIGALHYRKYNFFIRWILRRISRSANGPTDTSRDHELTDWSVVEAFARQCAEAIAPTGATGATNQVLR